MVRLTSFLLFASSFSIWGGQYYFSITFSIFFWSLLLYFPFSSSLLSFFNIFRRISRFHLPAGGLEGLLVFLFLCSAMHTFTRHVCFALDCVQGFFQLFGFFFFDFSIFFFTLAGGFIGPWCDRHSTTSSFSAWLVYVQSIVCFSSHAFFSIAGRGSVLFRGVGDS